MNKKIILFLLILVSLCAISQVSAADSTDCLATDNADDIEVQGIEETDFEESFINQDSQVNDDKIKSENNNYREIQDKIDQASEGATIDLEGEYVCDYLITVNKSVNIVGTGNGATIKYNITTEHITPFFWITENATNVSLKNIKFVGGTFLWGGAINWNGENGTISDCVFINNQASSENAIGGAIVIIADNCKVINCTFTGNSANLHAGALLCNGTGGTISDCTFNDNFASGEESFGGAITIYGNDYKIINCNFTNNHVSDYGGAISVLQGRNNLISDCRFNANYVSKGVGENKDYVGGGAIFSACIGLTINNCNFTGNIAKKSWGGAISLSDEDVLNNSYFRDNSALSGNDLYGNGAHDITYNTFVIDFNESNADAIRLNLTSDYDIPYGELLKYFLEEMNNTLVKIKENSTVKFSAGMIFQYDASGSIYVTVEGGHIDLANITVLNHPEAKITFANTLLTVSNLAVGKYTLRVTTTPDENHTSVDGDLSITVNKATAAVKASKITVALKSGSVWTISVVDSRNNKPIANMNLALQVFTGNKYVTEYVTTNSNGVATYKTNKLTQGTHKVVVSTSDARYLLTPLTSSISVVKQTVLKFKLQSKRSDKGGALLSYIALNKKTKKGINGIQFKVSIYTGKTFKTYIIKSKKVKGKKKTYMGAFGFSTNAFSAGKHKVVITPVSIKYKGTIKTTITIKKAATKGPKYFRKV